MAIDPFFLVKFTESKPRCEMCELILCTYVTGVEQQLQLAMWIDHLTRFGAEEKLSEAIAKAQERATEVETTWKNYLVHRRTHTLED
jgi:hypothetical protein